MLTPSIALSVQHISRATAEAILCMNPRRPEKHGHVHYLQVSLNRSDGLRTWLIKNIMQNTKQEKHRRPIDI